MIEISRGSERRWSAVFQLAIMQLGSLVIGGFTRVGSWPLTRVPVGRFKTVTAITLNLGDRMGHLLSACSFS